MKLKKKQHKNTTLVGTVPKYKKKIVERGKMDTFNTQIHDRSLSWNGTGTSIKNGGTKLHIVL
jgi:hypothetical protein